jgi:hypothetical protein
VACTKSPEETPKSTLSMKNQILTQIDVDTRVDEFFKTRYKKYNEQNKCWIRVFSAGTYCVTIKVIAHQESSTRDLIYVVESGSPMDQNRNLLNFHAAAGLMTLFLIEDVNEQLKIIAESEEIMNGAFGTPNDNVKTYRIGSDGQLGLRLVNGYGNQGVFSGSLALYMQKDNKIVEVAELNTYSGNSGACGDEKDQICNLFEEDLVVEVVNAASKKYFDLKLTQKTADKEMGKPMIKSEKTYVIQFDEKKFAYDLEKFNKASGIK